MAASALAMKKKTFRKKHWLSLLIKPMEPSSWLFLSPLLLTRIFCCSSEISLMENLLRCDLGLNFYIEYMYFFVLFEIHLRQFLTTTRSINYYVLLFSIYQKYLLSTILLIFTSCFMLIWKDTPHSSLSLPNVDIWLKMYTSEFYQNLWQ